MMMLRYCDSPYERQCGDNDGLSYDDRLRKMLDAWDNVDDNSSGPFCKGRSSGAVKDEEDGYPLTRSLVAQEVTVWAEKPNAMPEVWSAAVLSDLSTDAGRTQTPSMSTLHDSDDADSDQLDLRDERPPHRACCGRPAHIVVDYNKEDVDELYRKAHEADRREPCYRFSVWVKPPEGKKCFPRYM